MRIRRRRTRWSTETSRDGSGGSLSAFGLLGAILVAAAISGLCFLYLWQGNRIRALTAATEEADRQLDAVQETNRILGVRIEEAFSLERIARIARDQLNMSEPTDIRYVPLPSDGSE